MNRAAGTCLGCGRELAGEFSFCPFCGAPVQAAVAPTEERKIVSVLFCDLVGFTAASEQQDPEDVRRRVRPYHARLRQEIERYGGTVEKFIGDAVVAAFGAPIAHEDDAERAVRAGLAILEAIDDLNASDSNLDLQVRLGINTGEAVVARGARLEQGEGIITGDVVNTAARIQTVAPINAVTVSEQTYRATRRVFDYEQLPAVSVKGKAQPLSLWRAKAARARYGSDVRREFSSPFVGRELEKPLLIATFERAAQQRSVQLITIVGEPGVGKSRLIAELLAYVHAKPEISRWKQGRCLPYGEGITFWALGEIVKAEAGILESDSPDVAAAKLDATVPPDELERQWLLQRLAPLVGAEAGSEAGRQELFTAWRRFLESLAVRRPSVLVFEDLHWADDALLSFIEHVAEWSQDVPLLLVCAARPELFERRPSWGAGLRNAQTINLSPLSDEETAALVSYLSKSIELSDKLERAVLERAGGNPLYAEEFVRFLADREVDPRADALDEAALPDTVQALIAARLDTLRPERKSLLQDAAVVGKVFWVGALAEIGGIAEGELEVALHELARKELVRPSRSSSMEGENEFAFWHLLVRDVAYSQIPRGERSRRHRSAAKWIERKAGERVEDLAEVLAHHYLEALELAEASGDTAQVAELSAPARRFLALAGERALGLDTAQAEARLARALELTPIDDPERSDLLVRWAEAAFQAGRLREAAEALDELLAAAVDERRKTDVVARALQLRSRVALRLAEPGHEGLAAKAVDLLERNAAGPALVPAYTQLANVQTIRGAYAEAIVVADRACAVASQLGLPEPARAVGYRGYARALLGDHDGLREMERAIDGLIAVGAGRDAAVLQNNLAIVQYPLEGPGRSLTTFEEALAFCARRGLAEVSGLLEGTIPGLLSELGRTAEALQRAAELIPVLEARGHIFSLVEVRAVDATIRLACGDDSIPVTIGDWLIETARAVGTADMNALVLFSAAVVFAAHAPERARAVLREFEQSLGIRESPYYGRSLAATVRIALVCGDRQLAERLGAGVKPRYPLEDHALCMVRAQLAEAADKAEAAVLYAEAADRWRDFGNVPERAYALLGCGRCRVALGQAAAEQPLTEARELFASMGYRPALTETDRLLDSAAAPTR